MSFKEDYLPGLRNVFIFLVICLLIYFAGTSKTEWLVIVVTPVLTGIFGFLVGKKNVKAAIGWAAIGLGAGLGFYFAI